MTIFWTWTAVLTLLALTLVLPPLIKRPRPAARDETVSARLSTIAILRDQKAQLDAELAAGTLDAAQHRVGVEEIERRVLEETEGSSDSGIARPSKTAAPHRAWKTALLVALGVPLLAAGIYSRIGAPQAIGSPAAVLATNGTDEVSAEQVEALLKTLAERMETKPDDVQGWTLLARTYGAMQRFPEADRAYVRATALAPQDAQLIVDHADVLAMMQGQRLAGEPARLIAKALQIDPKNVKGLALAGGLAFESSNFAQAVRYWTQARELTPPGTEFANSLSKGIEEATAAGKNAPGGLTDGAVAMPNAPMEQAAAPTTAPATSSTAATTAGTAARVAGQVSLSPALASKVAPTDTVFIFARAADGPRMPLAILRRTVADLPIAFTLDDTMAMSPEMKLSKFPVVVVGARVSKSGNAMPSAGDLTGQVAGVKTGVEGLQIVIDSVQP